MAVRATRSGLAERPCAAPVRASPAARDRHDPGCDRIGVAIDLDRLGAASDVVSGVLAQPSGPTWRPARAFIGAVRGERPVVGKRVSNGVGGGGEHHQEPVGLVDLPTAPRAGGRAPGDRGAPTARPSQRLRALLQRRAVDDVGEEQRADLVHGRRVGGAVIRDSLNERPSLCKPAAPTVLAWLERPRVVRRIATARFCACQANGRCILFRMSPERMRLLSELLDQAMEMRAEEQEAWLATLQGDAAEVVPLLRKMLSGRIDTSAGKRWSQVPEFTALGEAASPFAFSAADQIGAYRLVQPLGRGGMGEVWIAERSDGAMKRTVALEVAVSRPSRRRAGAALRAGAGEYPRAAGPPEHRPALRRRRGRAQGNPTWRSNSSPGGTSRTSVAKRVSTSRRRLRMAQQLIWVVQHAHSNWKPRPIKRRLRCRRRRVTG